MTDLITRDFVTLVPAYGRDYKSAKECKADFIGGRDFQIRDFQYGDCYTSVRDFAAGVRVNIRYKNLTQVCVVKVGSYAV